MLFGRGSWGGSQEYASEQAGSGPSEVVAQGWGGGSRQDSLLLAVTL